jgi:hypothetical protein
MTFDSPIVRTTSISSADALRAERIGIQHHLSPAATEGCDGCTEHLR